MTHAGRAAGLLRVVVCALLPAVLGLLLVWQPWASATTNDPIGRTIAQRWERARRPEYARFSTRIRPIETEIGASELLHDYDPASGYPVPVTLPAATQSLRTLLRERWPEAIDPALNQAAPAAALDTGFASRLLIYEPDRITLLVQNRVRGLLVIDEPVLPGWDADLDGLATPILRANGTQRAVILAPALAGHPHEVTFVYRPAVVRLERALGMFLLALAGGLLLALAVVAIGEGRLRQRFAGPIPQSPPCPADSADSQHQREGV